MGAHILAKANGDGLEDPLTIVEPEPEVLRKAMSLDVDQGISLVESNRRHTGQVSARIVYWLPRT